MTLTIINHFTHNKTISIYDGKPNGAVKKLLSSGFHLNPRVHDDIASQTDGYSGPSSALTSDKFSPPKENVIGVKGPSDIFGKDLVMDE